MPELWAAADAGLVTSRNEGTPSALIEAMASGKPFVSTNVGGIIDLAAPPIQVNGRSSVIRAGNGFLTPLDSNPMLDCLEFLAGNPDFALEMGSVGRSFALTRYSDTRLQSDMEGLYVDLLGLTSSATGRHVTAPLKQSA